MHETDPNHAAERSAVQAGAAKGFARGRKVRAMSYLDRIAAAASIDRIVQDEIARRVKMGNPPELAAMFGLGYRAAFEGGIAGRPSLKYSIRRRPPVAVADGGRRSVEIELQLVVERS